MNAMLQGARRRSAEPSAPSESSRSAIIAQNLVKEFPTKHGVRRVLDDISFRVERGERLAVLGRNGAGKSTLIQILAGLQQPTSGQVHRGLYMSWPLALGGGFEGEMSGYDNMRFISRIYNVPFPAMFDFVADFTELGRLLYEPVRFYSSGMRMRLGFAISLAVDFECLLIDEVILVGDRRFQDKCQREIFENRRHCGMILAVHALDVVQEYCSHALVLKDGRGRVFSDVKRACSTYATI